MKNIKSKIILLLVVILSTACSFNKMYLQPTKVPANTKRLKMSTKSDTVLVQFDSDTYQPTFLKNDIDTIHPNFSIESVLFKSSNGNELNGWILKPKNATPTITLLHFHGNAGFLLSQYNAVAPLIEYGFQIFMFDYSGFGFSEGKATRENVLIDAHSSLDYIKTRSDVKDTKIVLYGQSLGGHLAAVVAEQKQADIDGLVIEGAFSSHKDIAAKTASIFGRIFVSEKYSAYKSIREYKKPILVIHSTEDEIIPFKMGQKIYGNANEPKEFYKIGKCHICGPQFYADSISQKIVNMLNSH